MKRFLSIMLALVLLVSMFAVTAVAFADDSTGDVGDDSQTPARDVTFKADAFDQYVYNAEGADDFYLEMDSNFMFENKWWEDAAKVHEIFDGINYRVQPKEELKDEDGNDKTEKYTVHYDYANPAEGEKYTDSTEPANGQYVETQHFRLPSAPTAKTHKEPAEAADGEEQKDVPNAYFAGWKITLGVPQTDEDNTDAPTDTELDELPVHLQGVFAANTDIAMPASDITVTAVWVENESDESEQQAKDMVIPDDVIYLLYVSPSGAITQDHQDWSRCLVTGTFSLTTEGEWNFRFAVVDGEKASKSGYTFDEDDILASTFDDAQAIIDQANENHEKVDTTALKNADRTLKFRVMDTTNPQVGLTDAQNNKQRDGLTVGTTYTIPTSAKSTDASSTTFTYKVYKQVGNGVAGADDEGWILIFDYKTRVVTEGYENCISTGGVITPLAEDVTDHDMYKIVYSAVDAYGYPGVKEHGDDEEPSTEEYKPVLLLRVYASATDPSTSIAIEAWKIVLYVIAGLSLIGIIVLLCIKPKQQTADARYNGSGNSAASDTDTDTESIKTEQDTDETNN